MTVKMKSFQGKLVVLLLGCYCLGAGYGAATTSPPTIRLFQTDSENKILKVVNVDPNSETILENIDSCRLECTADYPVQWVYSGNGVPLMESKIISTSATEYRATAFIGKLAERHTGKYKCASTEQPEVLTYYYLYVPGPVLFNSNSGKELQLNSNSIQIPCTVSSPRIAVYLQKPVGAPLEGQAQYDPRRGFYFTVIELRKAEGVYLCKATYRGSTNVLEYQVKVEQEQLPQIQSDYSSAFNSSKSPCNPQCANNAKCVFTNGASVCECLEPFRGDGYRSCERPEQKKGECSTHTDCPSEKSCFADFVCRDPCTNSLHGLECGTNAVCKTVDHQPECACPGGHSGDPLKSCRSSFQGDQPTSTRRPARPAQASSTSRPKCDCGPDCECICRTDADCEKGHICNGTMCTNPCNNLCGRNAVCKVIQGVGLCSCPRGFRGDPWESCVRINTEKRQPLQSDDSFAGSSRPAKTCVSDSDCPSKYTCDTYKCIDPCDKCVPNASCDLFDGGSMPRCRCPEGYTGDGTVSCTPDVHFEVGTVNYSVETQTACSNISCGLNGECRIYDGLPKCNCQAGYVGNPPNCKTECKENGDCKDHQVCVQKRCRSACFGKCGKFARCMAEPGTRTPKCVCRKGYAGDPLKECVPSIGVVETYFKK